MFRPSLSSLLVLLLAIAACQPEPPSQQAKPSDAPSAGTDESDKPAATDNQPVDVQVTKPTRRELIYQVTLPANISPLYQTTLYAKVSGYLKWIGPDKGDAVKKDQILAIIDAPEVEEQYHQALSDYHIKNLTI
jgi:multidrug efflux pump subunit AcrA (membrane-fusion protein)